MLVPHRPATNAERQRAFRERHGLTKVNILGRVPHPLAAAAVPPRRGRRRRPAAAAVTPPAAEPTAAQPGPESAAA